MVCALVSASLDDAVPLRRFDLPLGIAVVQQLRRGTCVAHVTGLYVVFLSPSSFQTMAKSSCILMSKLNRLDLHMRLLYSFSHAQGVSACDCYGKAQSSHLGQLSRLSIFQQLFEAIVSCFVGNLTKIVKSVLSRKFVYRFSFIFDMIFSVIQDSVWSKEIWVSPTFLRSCGLPHFEPLGQNDNGREMWHMIRHSSSL